MPSTRYAVAGLVRQVRAGWDAGTGDGEAGAGDGDAAEVLGERRQALGMSDVQMDGDGGSVSGSVDVVENRESRTRLWKRGGVVVPSRRQSALLRTVEALGANMEVLG